MANDTNFTFGHNDTEQVESCGATIECPHCRMFFGFCAELVTQLKENTMLPSSEGAPASDVRRKKSGGMEYLTNEMLSTKSKAEAKILAVKYDEENRFGPRVVLKFAMFGKTIYWGVVIKKNPNYKILEAEFGREENEWVGKTVLLQLEKDDFSESYFPRVSFPDDAGKKPGRSR